MLYRCPLCGRDKFDRPYQPHNCVGGFRKKLPPFEAVMPRVVYDIITGDLIVNGEVVRETGKE